ncbi:hypothetical protein Aduo_009797 [Ancylostoma duodenale]
MHDFAERMKKLVERVTLGQSNPVQNERLLDEFLDRLKPALKFYVKASNPPIYDEAVVKALIYESLLTEAVNNLTIFPAANSATAQVNVATTQDANQGYDRRNQPQRFRSRSQFPSGYAYQNRTYSRRSFERAPNSEPPQQNSRGYPAAPNYLRGYRSGGPSNRWYRGCQCEDGACAMESGAAVIWKPDAEESCQFISVAAMKGTMADKWGNEQQSAFTQLRDALLKEPILGYPDYDKPFHIFTDASSVAQAGALITR